MSNCQKNLKCKKIIVNGFKQKLEITPDMMCHNKMTDLRRNKCKGKEMMKVYPQ